MLVIIGHKAHIIIFGVGFHSSLFCYLGIPEPYERRKVMWAHTFFVLLRPVPNGKGYSCFMRKRTIIRLWLLLSLVFIIPSMMRAGVVTEQDALLKAKQFMPGKNFQQQEKASHAPMRGGQADIPAYYVFNADEDDGFVIVSADDRTSPVLGYSDHGHIDETDMPDNMKAWLNTYKEAITSLRSTPEALSSSYVSPERENIEPLLQTHWSQTYPYNLLCPLYEGERSLTGCVATAMAQIMYYHKWPISETTSIPPYKLIDSKDSTNTLTLDELPPTYFDWDKMRTTTNENVKDISNSVAKLMQYCGHSILSNYGPLETSASSESVPYALSNYFGYHKGLQYISHSDYSENDWELLIYNEIKNFRPVFYDGYSGLFKGVGGHAFVCDGYKDGYFHMNFGWGTGDGYFLLSFIPAEWHSRMDAYKFQGAIVGIKPSYSTDTGIGLSFDNNGFRYTIINDSSVSIQNIEGQTYSGFEGTLTIPDNVTFNEKRYYITELGPSAGYSNYQFSNLILPSTLTSIETNACFITGPTIVIPSNVRHIALGAFSTSSIGSIYVDENEMYKTIDGVLFSSDGKELIYYPIAKSGTIYSVPDGTKRISGKAFMGNNTIDSIFLPTSLEYIGSDAFRDSKIKRINLTDSIYEIGERAFMGCLNITEIEIPSALEYLSSYVFSGCKLDTITSRSSIPTTIAYSFDDDVYNQATLYIPIGTKEIYDNHPAWKRFATVKEKELTIDENLINQKKYDFKTTGNNTVSIGSKNSLLAGRLVIPEYTIINGQKYYVKSVEGSLNNNKGVTSVVLPETMELLYSAFGNYESLESITIPKNMMRIENCFGFTKNLKTIDLNPDNIHFCIKDGILFSKDKKRIVIMPEGLEYKNYVIPEGVEDIESSFHYNKNIESVYIPSSIKKMHNAFIGCSNLKSVTFADGLKIIDGFQYCTSLEEITIPASVDIIAPEAFLGCDSLKKIIIKQTTPCFIDNIAEKDYFDTITYENTTLVVPIGCSDAYISANNWSKFKHIEEESFCDIELSLNRIIETIDGITYNCNISTKEAIVIKGASNSELTIPSTIDINGVSYAVTEIGPYAFGKGIKSLIISEGIRTIERWAFTNCAGLYNLTLPNSLREIGPCAFWNCSGLSDITIPEGVIRIGTQAFESCEHLERLVLPSTLQYIGSSAFARCNNLSSVTVRAINPPLMHGDAFAEYEFTQQWTNTASLYIPNGTISNYGLAIGWSKFQDIMEGEVRQRIIDDLKYECYPSGEATLIGTNITSSTISIPSSIIVDGITYNVTSIGSDVFRGNDSLLSVSLSDGIKAINEYAFYNCTNLTNVELPSTLETIDQGAFQECSSLNELTIPEGVKTIGSYAFQGCINLKKIELPSTLTFGGNSLFFLCRQLSYVIVRMEEPIDIDENAFNTLPSYATLVVPIDAAEKYKSLAGWNSFNSVIEGDIIETTISGMMFYAFTGPQKAKLVKGVGSSGELVIPATIIVDGNEYNVTEIGERAFEYETINSIKISEGITTIGEMAFYQCGFVKIDLPSTISIIEQNAFYGISLSYAIVRMDEPINIDKKFLSISSYSNPILFVPKGTICKYQQNNGWNIFKTILEGEIIETTLSQLTYILFTGTKTATLIKSADSISELIIPSTVLFEGYIYNVETIDKYAFKENDSITNVIISEGIKKIGIGAFADCKKLKSVQIPSSIDTIESMAFVRCDELCEIIIPEGVKTIENCTFLYCKNLSRVDLPSTICSISEYAFEGCNSLSYLTVRMIEPIDINECVFEGIPSSTTLVVPTGSTTKYQSSKGWNNFDNIFEGEIKQTTVCGLKYYTFTGSKKAILINGKENNNSEIVIPSQINDNGTDYDVIKIGENAFAGNLEIENIIISEGIMEIGDYAFEGCSKIDNITIPEGVTRIGLCAFQKCKSLLRLELPSTTSIIEKSAFFNCNNLSYIISHINEPNKIVNSVFNQFNATLVVPVGATIKYKAIDTWKYFNSIMEMEGNMIVVELNGLEYYAFSGSKKAILIKGNDVDSEINIPASIDIEGTGYEVTTIGKKAFYNCDHLKIINLPSTTTTIEDGAFMLCRSLQEIIIPQGVTSIGSSAFLNCTELINIDIPSTISIIRDYAFGSCIKLSCVTVRMKEPVTIDNSSFYNLPTTAVLCVPEGTASKYQEKAGWNTFAIIAEPVVITANDYTIQYGEEIPDFKYTCYGIELSGTPQITCSATKQSPVGTYPIVISKGSVTNYNDTYIDGTLTITKTPLTITANDCYIWQDDTLPVLNVTYQGFKNGEDSTALAKLPVVIPEVTGTNVIGEYDICVSGAESQNYDITYIPGKLTVKERIPGDVTGSGAVDIQDATIVVNYILGERSENYVYYMADLNKDDEIDVFDVTAIINVILARTSFHAPIRMGSSGYKAYSYPSSNRSSYSVREEYVYLQTISDKMGLSIANASRFTSFQMDVEVPDGAELQNVELTGSKSTHFIQKAKIGDNLYRVIALSMSSQPLADGNDDLVSFQLSNTANGEISVSNVMFVTPKGEAHSFNGVSTMTPTIMNEIKTDKDEVIFDLSGKRIYKKPKELERGVYIINNEKVIIK